jgi:hypothetical protein
MKEGRNEGREQAGRQKGTKDMKEWRKDMKEGRKRGLCPGGEQHAQGAGRKAGRKERTRACPPRDTAPEPTSSNPRRGRCRRSGRG